MTKEQRTIKEQAAKIAELTKTVEEITSRIESIKKCKDKYCDELDDIHATFDLLGIPDKVKNTYHELSANARLTLFLAQTNGIKVEQYKEGE